MLRPIFDIRFTSKATGAELFFDYVHEVEIVSTWKDLTKTAKILLPRNLKLKDKSLKEVLKVGDKVVVQLGYDVELNEEFTGYIARVEPNIPVVIYCEDEMWQLKKGTITKHWVGAKLSQIIKDIIPGTIPTDISDVYIGDFKAEKATPAQILKAIHEGFGLSAYFRKGKLCVGLPYPTQWAADETKKVKLHFQRDIPHDGNKLEYRNAEDIKLKVEAKWYSPNGKVATIAVGDSDGEVHTLSFFASEFPLKDLKEHAEREMKKIKVDGYKGGLLCFGKPYCEHGYVAQLEDDEYPERAGSYFIDKTVVKSGINGFRRTLDIGGRAA